MVTVTTPAGSGETPADPPPAVPSDAADDAAHDAERRMYDAEVALHAARQSGVDAWVAAAYDRLHAAIADHLAAVTPHCA